MHRFRAPLVLVGLLASSAIGGLACSRSGLQPGRAADAAGDGQVDVGARDGSDTADAVAPPDLAGGPRCGDGQLDRNEECDDGNTIVDDGCSRICQREPDGAVCGDGIITPDEECDCGDGSVPLPDGCLDANDDAAYGGCTTGCRWGGFCGDGMVNGPPRAV